MDSYPASIFQASLGRRFVDPTSLIERIRKLRAVMCPKPSLLGLSDKSVSLQTRSRFSSRLYRSSS